MLKCLIIFTRKVHYEIHSEHMKIIMKSFLSFSLLNEEGKRFCIYNIYGKKALRLRANENTDTLN